MSELSQDLLSLLVHGESRLSTTLFLGAGVAIDNDVPSNCRLPSGSQMRNRLVQDRFPNLPSPAEPSWEAAAEKSFRNDYNVLPAEPFTADTVWRHLVQPAGQLRRYYPVIQGLFKPGCPVPSAYYNAFRWMLRSQKNGARVASVVTTNYDEHLDGALRETLRLQQADPNFGRVLAIAQDFAYHPESPGALNCPVLKIHGTLSHPWSIIGGDKNLATGLTKDEAWIKDVRYAALNRALRASDVWVFVGYSFGETAIPEVIQKALSDIHPVCVVVVDCVAPLASARRIFDKPTCKSRVVYVTSPAAEFFRDLLDAHEDRYGQSPALLSEEERRVLQVGSAHLPDREPARVVGNLGQSAESNFCDIVHGEIHFAEPAVASKILRIVDSGEMQRLRQVRQLSFVNLKYPGATHDRFSHVLGVAFLADSLFAQLSVPSSGKASTELRAFLDTDTDARSIFAAAALLHDIGHGPYGHAMDLVRRKGRGSESHEADSLAMLQLAEESKSFGDLGRVLHDQKLSATSIAELLKNRSTHPLSTAIAAKRSFDLDRLDFIMRDALVARPEGVLKNKLNPDSRLDISVTQAAHFLRENTKGILKSIVPAYDAAGKLCLAFEIDPTSDKLLFAAAHLYRHLYENVYFCWQNIAAQHMLDAAIREVLASGRLRFSDLLPLVDGELLKLLEDSDRPAVRDLTYSIKNRRLYPVVFRARFTTPSKELRLRLDEGLHAQLPALPLELFVDVRAPRPFEILALRESSSVPKHEVFAEMQGLIQVFAWPRRSFEDEKIKKIAIEIATSCGVELEEEPISSKSSVEQLPLAIS